MINFSIILHHIILVIIHVFHPFSPIGIGVGFITFVYVTGIDLETLMGEGIIIEKFLIFGAWIIYSVIFYYIVYHRKYLRQQHLNKLRRESLEKAKKDMFDKYI